MHVFRQHRRFISWLAALAIVLNALMPTVSHAMAAAQQEAAPWLEVCTVYGIKYLSQSAQDQQNADPAPERSDMQNMQHCPYCTVHAASVVVLHDTGPPVLQPLTQYRVAALFLHSPRPLFVWASSNPRAPPAQA